MYNSLLSSHGRACAPCQCRSKFANWKTYWAGVKETECKVGVTRRWSTFRSDQSNYCIYHSISSVASHWNCVRNIMFWSNFIVNKNRPRHYVRNYCIIKLRLCIAGLFSAARTRVADLCLVLKLHAFLDNRSMLELDEGVHPNRKVCKAWVAIGKTYSCVTLGTRIFQISQKPAFKA